MSKGGPINQAGPNAVDLGFDRFTYRIPVADILPLRQVTPAMAKSRKYVQIAASIGEVGLVESPVVVRDTREPGKFHLVDGHLRIHIIKARGDTEVDCLIATEDEAFTYNRRISRLTIVQEHKMILNALERGVSEERLARALNINVRSLRQKRDLLHGICPEAAELLKDKHVPTQTIGQLKKVKPMRQIEAAELMVALNRYTFTYARALIAATPSDQFIKKKRVIKGLTRKQIATMENESANLDRDFRAIEPDYGSDQLDLVVAMSYVSRLLENGRLVRYLVQKHPDKFAEFQRVAERREAVRSAGNRLGHAAGRAL